MRMRPVRPWPASCAPGNAGANNAADQIAVAERAIAQIPAAHIETIELVLRVDSAGAQLSFTDHDGHRFQAILTDQTGPVAELERDHRGRARVEDHIRNDKDTGMRNLPFRTFEHNQVWLQIVALARDLIAWTQRLL